MTIRRLFLLLPLLLLISCDKEDPRLEAEDDRNPYFKEAQEAIHDRDFEKAVKSYETALRKNPKVAAAHYEIGMLYSEKLGDPIKTIYHLQRFLDERPNTDKAEMAKGHLDNAKITFAATLPNSPVQNAELFAKIQSDNLSLKKEREELYKKITEMEHALSASKEEQTKTVALLEEEKVKAAKTLEEATLKATQAASAVVSPVVPAEVNSGNLTDKVNPVAVQQPSTPAAATTQAQAALNKGISSTVPNTIQSTVPNNTVNAPGTFSAPPSNSTPAATAARSYTIQKGDTLWKISKKHYPKDVVNGIERIKNANLETLPEGKPLKIGTAILIP